MNNLIIIVIFIFSFSINAQDYSLNANGPFKEVAKHLYSENHFFRNYIINGTFEDNLGNYGSTEIVVVAEYKIKKVINLQWSAEITYQNNKKLFMQGLRERGVDEGGVGKAIFLTADKPLSILNGNKCKYAINFFNDRIFSKFRCDISYEAIKVLENLNK